MTNDTKQDHPGPEWIESPGYVLDGSIMGGFHHPGLNRGVDYIGNSHAEAFIRREEAITRCRAISAAALAWERLKVEHQKCAVHECVARFCPNCRGKETIQ